MPRFAINSASLGGSLDAKLRSAKLAGFQGIGVWESDLRNYPEGSQAARNVIAEHGMHVPEVFTLRDWQLSSGDAYTEALRRAHGLFEFLSQHSYQTAVVVGSVDVGPLDLAVQQLRDLCDLASPYGVRLAYEQFAWARSFSRFDLGWEMVRRTERDNVGLVLDTFHFFMSGSTIEDLKGIPAHGISLVHLADAPDSSLDVVSLCRHHRLFPGTGRFPMAELVAALQDKGFAGWYCLELFNDEYSRRDPAGVAQEAMRAAQGLFAAAK